MKKKFETGFEGITLHIQGASSVAVTCFQNKKIALDSGKGEPTTFMAIQTFYIL